MSRRIFLILLAASPLGAVDIREAAREFYEQFWTHRNYDAAGRIFASSYLSHDPRNPVNPATESIQQMKEAAAQWHNTADASARIDFQSSDGSVVTTRWTFVLTPKSFWQRTLAGRDKIEVAATDMMRFENGKVVEIWRLRDDLGAQEQLGVTRLYYLQGFAIGLITALVLSRILGRKRPAVQV